MPKAFRALFNAEESYVFPVVQDPPSSLQSPPISPDGRLRRTRGSSFEDDPTVGDMLNEDYRAGGPRLAVLPCLTAPLSKDNTAAITWESDLEFVRSILDVLRQHGIEAKYVELFGRQVQKRKRIGQRGGPCHACFDICNIFLQKGLRDLNIEIVYPRSLLEKFATPGPSTHPIYPHWEDISMRIMYKIGREGWLALECFRWGESWGPSSLDRSENPVTVILTSPHDSEKDWKHAREEIVSVLADFQLHDVAVSILRGEIWDSVGRPPKVALSDNAWEREAQLGMSIGPSNSDLSASTLGAFIELKSPEGKWMRFGLTCFHSVIANKKEKDMGSKKKKWYNDWKQNGIGPKDKHADILKMEQPALKDHKHALEGLNKSIDGFLNDSEFQQIQKDIKADNFAMSSVARQYYEIEANLQAQRVKCDSIKDFFPNKAYLGRAHSASGFRRTEENPPARLDWALIEIENIPPKGGYVTRDYEFKGRALAGPLAGTVSENHELFKIGRTTNFTKGRFTGLRSILLPPSEELDDKGKPFNHETWKHTVTGFGGQVFSDPGDSGAMIFDKRAQFVGLLIGGNDHTKTAYFTP